MVKIMNDPVIIINKDSETKFEEKIKELNIEIISKFEKGDQTSYHIYCEAEVVTDIIGWLNDEDSIDAIAEL